MIEQHGLRRIKKRQLGGFKDIFELQRMLVDKMMLLGVKL